MMIRPRRSTLPSHLQRKFCFQSVLLGFLSLTLALHVTAQNQSAPDDVVAISDALRNHDFAQALNLSQSAVAKNPGDYRIWTLRGMATAGTGDLPKALLDYQHALRLAPNYLPALEGVAQTEFQLGKPDAEVLLEKVLVERPDDPTTHALLAVLAYRRKDCTEAVDHFAKARAAIASQPAALTDYGSCLAMLHRDEEAVNAFADALALAPAKADARYNLALAQWDAHHGEDALKTLAPLTDATPPSEDALSLAADIYESENDTASAVALLRRALENNPKDTPVYLQFAALSFDHTSPQVGIDILNFGLGQLPNEPRLYLVRGILLTQLGEFTRAADDFESASRLDPRQQFLGVAEGLVSSQQHNSALALARFRAAVKTHPNEAYAHYLLAEALLDENTRQGSAENIEERHEAARAVELDPKLTAAHDLLATLYVESGDADQAIQQSRAALAIDPSDQQAVYHLIVALRKTSQKDEIPDLLKRLVELRSNSKNGNQQTKHYRLYEEAPASNSPAQ